MRIVLFANTEWYLYNFRLNLAAALRDEGHELLLISPSGPYGERLKALGFDWRPLPMSRRSLNPFVEIQLVRYLVKLFKAEHIDLVHSFTIKSAVYGSLAARLAGVPLRVSAVTGLGYVFSSKEFRATLLRPMVRLAIRLAFSGENTRMVLQNPDDVSFFTSRGLVSEEHVRLIKGSGVNLSRFSPPGTTAAVNTKEVCVLYASRLLWDKGLQELIDAIGELKQRGIKARFLFAGEPDDGNPASVPVSVVEVWQREGLIEYLGHVEDMPALYHTVDLVVLPSYREGLPKGLIEAAACSLPIITTDVPGCREVIEDGATGLLVKHRDSQSLAAALERLITNNELRIKMGQRGRAKVMAEFDEKMVIQQTLEVYSELESVG